MAMRLTSMKRRISVPGVNVSGPSRAVQLLGIHLHTAMAICQPGAVVLQA